MTYSRTESIELVNMCMIYNPATQEVLVEDKTGLTVSQLESCGTVEWFNESPAYRRLGFLYRTSHFSGTLKQSEEGQNYWLPLKDLNEANTAESFMKFLQIFTDLHTVDATSPVMNGSLTIIPKDDHSPKA